MRVLHALKRPSRFLVLAPLIGASVALLVLVWSPGPAAAQTQEFPDQTCTLTTCSNIGAVGNTNCPPDVNCNLMGDVWFQTCQPTGTGCINSGSLYGFIGCVGRCGTGGVMCGLTVFFCAN